ncbi:hypothetical protein FIM1_4314 [Kluyveromyces marxianus]|uniref:Uncharacterized protein n=1 Tax=Kluyveromyces marxianus TaxID=4911 RepID=A0ABX6F0J5_KLUMA|nr:hypothetical protein FIM1_4314 [Kluyveromyces marxianus]
MNASTGLSMLTCSKHRNIYLNSSVDAWWAIECGKQYGKENRKELSSHAVEDYVHPPIYVQGHFTGENDLGYVACGDRFVLAYTNSTTLQQAWQCGVLDSLPVSRSAASHTLKMSLVMYLLLLVGYFVYE